MKPCEIAALNYLPENCVNVREYTSRTHTYIVVENVHTNVEGRSYGRRVLRVNTGKDVDILSPVSLRSRQLHKFVSG